MATDHELRVHRDWIGLLQPVGLVVSPPALLAAQAFPDKNIIPQQQALLALITPIPPSPEARRSVLPPRPLSFASLATEVLGWRPNRLVGLPGQRPVPDSLDVVLPEFGETLRPTYAVQGLPEDAAPVRGSVPPAAADHWMILIQELSPGTSLDDAAAEDGRAWHASPQARLERLLRETAVPIGILCNGHFIRLVYAPRGESSGHITWPVHRLGTALDREMLSALVMLLGNARLFTNPHDQRLPHILKESRKYQNVVSTKLAGQVLEALNELLRGFQSANEAAKGGLLDATVREDPDHVYGGLLAVLLRLVFILYAEERGLLSTSAAYVRNYSLVGLFDKLRIDAGRFPDTMDQRYGAWSRLLVLFRMVHDGANRGDLRLPPRYGHLFDPDGWGFLEGRPHRINRVMGAPVEVPKVADGVVLRVLEKLLLLDSDRLSYRALDVEQIGSVYENMMGFRLERAVETSIGVGKEHVVVGLETLLTKKGTDREKLLKETANVEVTGRALEALKAAATVDDLVAALGRRISSLTPRTVPAGGLYLQPTDERRRSGSHYTPRELTEPIVRTTLRPILEDLGSNPKPDQLLALKVCDPAMGSGAFLVETCRQLAEQLVKSYDVHGRPSDIPPDEDVLLYAQRQVAQHCLYGIDKNPFAVDLGKLSLWLATLARGHAFTFLDHSIRHGDSLVGLTREQIASFHWAPEKQIPVVRAFVDKAIAEAMALRAKIPDLANSDDVREKRQLLGEADDALAKVRMVGDAVVASFFSAEKPKLREESRKCWETKTQSWLSGRSSSGDLSTFIAELRKGEKPVPCFHWEVEFPEVFERPERGFDGLVGNPPFAGVKQAASVGPPGYTQFLRSQFESSGGKCDLVAFFFRRAFTVAKPGAVFGFVSTNTIAQGDTRTSGLTYICEHGGRIIAARRRIRWPGKAAVIVSTVHVAKRRAVHLCELDGRATKRISAFLLAGTQDRDPIQQSNRPAVGIATKGVVPYGMGFVFEDNKDECEPLSTLKKILREFPEEGAVVHRFLGGSDLNSHVSQCPDRFIVDFGDMTEEDSRHFGHVFEVVERRVKPSRAALTTQSGAANLKRWWWRFGYQAKELRADIANRSLDRVLVTSQTSKYRLFAFAPSDWVFDQKVVVFANREYSFFCALQARPHEEWADFIGSTMKDDPVYTPSDCFDTYPLPESWEASGPLEDRGRAYYEFRASLMLANNIGLTDLCNRFHDPGESDDGVLRLRELHAAMDRAILDAYGWTDLQPTCEFLLDYEEEEDDAESAGGRRKKKPWRYRWPDDFRDEVLARLLELNAQRAKAHAGDPPPLAAEQPGASLQKPRGRAKSAKKATSAGQGTLFDGGDDE